MSSIKALLFFLPLLLIVSSQNNTTTSNTTSSNTTSNTTTSNTTTLNTTTSNTTIIISNNDSSCNGAFYSSSRFQSWGLIRPQYLAEAAISTNLTYCRMFNNISSCCSQATDDDIKAYYDKYKEGLANVTTDRMQGMKKVFDQYKNISVDSSLANVTGLNETLKNLTQTIKNQWITINQEIVSCAKASLKLSIGLLCTGCSTNHSASQQNGSLLLNSGACQVLAESCFRLVQSLNTTQNSSRDNAMQLTDAITGFIGDSVMENTTNTSSTVVGGLFGDLSTINLTANLSSRILQEKGHNESDGRNGSDQNRSMEDPMKVLNDTMNYFMKLFPDLRPETFLVCNNETMNNTRCQQHPLILHMENHTLAHEIMRAFQERSPWAFFPIYVPLMVQGRSNRLLQKMINATDLSTNFTNFTKGINNSNSSVGVNMELNFIFTHMKPNMDLLKFLISKDITLDNKLAKIHEIELSITKALEQFVLFFNSSEKLGENRTMADQSEIKGKFGDNKILSCIFQSLDQAFRDRNQSIFNNNCSFNLTFGENGNLSLCDRNVSSNFSKDLQNCSQNASNISSLLGSCGNKSCVICLGPQCFTQGFDYKEGNKSADMNYSKEDGRSQYQEDDRVSLKTGKRIPDFVKLPDISKLTNYNFKAPCNDIQECSQWFCTKFLRGPVARLEKVYNPQETDDELDNKTKNFYLGNITKSIRLLLDSSSTDVMITSTGGVDFNTVAESSSLNTSISIDGVSVSADTYMNMTTLNTSNSTNSDNGSFGDKTSFWLGASLGMIILLGTIA